MRIYGTDAKGWLFHEKACIVLSYWLFMCLHVLWFRPLSWLTRNRVNPLDNRCWLGLGSRGYLYDRMRRDDMPEHARIGGVWR